jgi:putative sigma-54 modulation protein
MQITVTGRHVDITNPLRTHIEKKMGKLRSYFDHIIEVRVVLSVEKYRQFAEITISGSNGVHFHSREATDDMYVSVDKAIEKIERQLSRRRTKTRQAKRRKSTESPEQPTEEESEQEERLEQHGSYRVTISDKFAPKPMSVEEAIMQLEVSEDDFLAFVNQQTDEVNVVFKKREGDYGLLRRSF